MTEYEDIREQFLTMPRIHIEPLYLIQHRMKTQQLEAEYESEMEFTNNMPPELLKIHMELKYKLK